MTEKRAWEFLAELWSKPFGQAVPYIKVTDQIICQGLCVALYDMMWVDMISGDTYRSMTTKLHNHAKKNGIFASYYWPRDAEGAKSRVEFCKTQGELC